MSRSAVIDIGTNSVKLTVADLTDTITVLKEDSRITRLGKNVDSDGRLNPEAIQRTLAVIEDFYKAAKDAGAESVIGAGTSALRDAVNGDELLAAVKSGCGLDVEIITGNREADLAFTAVARDPSIVSDKTASIVVFDIGGGSTELVWGVDGVVKDHVSLNIGALRLTERHFLSDPPTIEEFNSAKLDGAESIRAFFSGKPAPSAICGVGGTASTFAAMIYLTRDVQGKEVDIGLLEKCVSRLRSMSLVERKAVAFLDPGRADIIIAGGAILLELLSQLHVQSYRVSLRGMRFGLLLEQKAALDRL